MPEGMNIPIRVTGGAEAKAEIQGVAQAASAAAAGGDAAGFRAWRASQVTMGRMTAKDIRLQFGTQDIQLEPSAAEAAAGEAVALEKSSTAMRGAGSATDQLLEKKRALANVVRMVGGSFGAEVGELGSLVSLLMTATAPVAAVAAGLAALAIGVKVFTDLKQAAEEAAAAQRAYNDAVAAGQGQKREQAATVAETLEKSGARSEENIKSALQMQQRLREEFGVPAAQAGEIGALSTAGGLGVEDAARLAVRRGAGAKIETPEQARKALEMAQQGGQSEALLQEAKRHAADLVGQRERIGAKAPMVGGTGEVSAQRAAYEAMKEQPGGLAASGLPSDFTFEGFQAAQAGDARAVARAMYPDRKNVSGKEYAAAEQAARAGIVIKPFVAQAADVQTGARGPEATPVFTAPEARTEAQAKVQEAVKHYNTYNIHTTNIATMYGGLPEPKTNWDQQGIVAGMGVEN